METKVENQTETWVAIQCNTGFMRDVVFPRIRETLVQGNYHVAWKRRSILVRVSVLVLEVVSSSIGISASPDIRTSIRTTVCSKQLQR